MSVKSRYVEGARLVRSGLGRAGVLPVLDEWAQRSRTGTWARSLLSIYDARELSILDVPWWTFDAARWVDAFLIGRRGARIFEWGSGASTVWLARRGASVTAVEHDRAWAEAVRDLVPSDVPVDLRTVVPRVATGAAGEARSQKATARNLDFREYADVIDSVGGTFDVIVIDGRAREACLSRAIPHLAEDGIIVFDNVERRRYRRAIAELGSHLTVTWTTGLTPGLPYPTRTAILRRNGSG